MCLNINFGKNMIKIAPHRLKLGFYGPKPRVFGIKKIFIKLLPKLKFRHKWPIQLTWIILITTFFDLFNEIIQIMFKHENKGLNKLDLSQLFSGIIDDCCHSFCCCKTCL